MAMTDGKTTKSSEIRRLASEGVSTAEIAARMGIRYQHAYNVLNQTTQNKSSRSSQAPNKVKAPLRADQLLQAGFRRISTWIIRDDGSLINSEAFPRDVGVYAFIKGEIVMYIGVATMSLAKRLNFYAKPGISQKTSIRLNKIILEELGNGAKIEILVAMPEDTQWNGLPVHGAAGLELGLIKNYQLPWNVRSAG